MRRGNRVRIKTLDDRYRTFKPRGTDPKLHNVDSADTTSLKLRGLPFGAHDSANHTCREVGRQRGEGAQVGRANLFVDSALEQLSALKTGWRDAVRGQARTRN